MSYDSVFIDKTSSFYNLLHLPSEKFESEINFGWKYVESIEFAIQV